MRIAITGGTGFVGSHLANHLDKQEELSVTVVSRSPDDSPVPISDGVERKEGDVTDASSLEPIFEDVEVVINLVALSPLFKPKKGLSHEKVHLGGTKNVVEVAESTGVDRIVQQSALGADPDADTEYLRTKGEAEQVVQESDLDWVIFRPSIIFGEGDEFIGFTKKLTTPYVTGLPGGGRTRFQPIWIGDFVPMLRKAAVEDEHVGKNYKIAGPEVVTLGRATKLAYKADGKSVSILPVPMPLAKIGMTAFEYTPFIPFGRDQYRSLKIDNTLTDENNDIDVFGYEKDELRTMEEYLGLE